MTNSSRMTHLLRASSSVHHGHSSSGIATGDWLELSTGACRHEHSGYQPLSCRTDVAVANQLELEGRWRDREPADQPGPAWRSGAQTRSRAAEHGYSWGTFARFIYIDLQMGPPVYSVTEPHTGAVGIPLNDCGSSGFRNIHQDDRQAVP